MKERIKYYNNFVNLTLGALIIFTALNYTENTFGSSVFKYFAGIILIIALISSVNINDYKWAGYLILIICIMPLFLMIIGVYQLDMQQSIEYIFLFIYYLVLIICLSNYYADNLLQFISVWQTSLTILLFSLLIVYKGISLRLGYLLNLTLSGQRYGGNLLEQRYGMGFANVNTLALFSILLIFCSFYQLYKGKRKLMSIIDIIASIVFILNAESRTPFILLITLAVSFMVVNVKNKLTMLYLENTFLIIGGLSTITFMVLFIHGADSILYQSINNFSSSRLLYGTLSFSFLESFGNVFWGVGPLNSSYITEKVFNNNFTLDNSIEYYVFTLGIIGAVFIYTYLFYLFVKVNKSYSKIGFVTSAFYFVFSFFENTIFLPVSAVTLLCLTIIFIVLRNTNNEANKQIINNSNDNI